MANMTATEQALVQALEQWTEKQGIILTQVNPFFFMQALRAQGLEIVKAEELVKIRYEHKFLKELYNTIFKTANSGKTKIQQLDENKDLLKERPELTTQAPPKRPPTGERPPRKV